MRLGNIEEGYSILPSIDREKYQERDGLEGPIMTQSGKVVYYDPKAGDYYDPDTDMYLSYSDFKALDSGNMHKIEELYSRLTSEAMSDEDEEKAMKRALQKSDEPERGEKRKKVTLKKAPWEESVEEFKPHMMYDPKTGKGVHAKKEKDHLDLKDKGYTHDNPKTKKVEEDAKGREESVKNIDNILVKMGADAPSDIIADIMHWIDAHPGEDLGSLIKQAEGYYQDELDEGYTHDNPKTKKVEESEERPYICVHAKKGKHECHAKSSYEAAKKAAAHWKLKSTSGIDAHLAVDEGITDIVKSVGNTFKRGFKSLTNRNNRPAKPPQPNQYSKRVKPGGNRPSIAQQINWGGQFESSNPAMDKALRSIEKTFGSERKAIDDQITAMSRAADMMTSERFKDRALSVVEQYGINSKKELMQELYIMIKNESAVDDDEIYGTDTNIKMMKNAISKLKGITEDTIKYFDSYDDKVVIEIDKTKFTYNGKPISMYDWNNAAKAVVTPGMHKRAKSWDEVHQYLMRYMGNPDGLQAAARQVFVTNDEDIQVNETLMVSEAHFDEAAGKKDACYHKVKSRYKVWPSAYASGALVKCRKVGASNWGNSKK